jgi:hypothetical protein
MDPAFSLVEYTFSSQNRHSFVAQQNAHHLSTICVQPTAVRKNAYKMLTNHSCTFLLAHPTRRRFVSKPPTQLQLFFQTRKPTRQPAIANALTPTHPLF